MEPHNSKRGVLLFSGGIDSTLAALILLGQGIELVSLTVNYPGRPEREVRAARMITAELAFSEVVEVTIETGGPLTKVPHSEDVDQGWIPYRNLLFWAIAAHKAAILDAGFVAAGHDDDDGVVFSDASNEFFALLARILTLTGSERRGQPVDIKLPVYTASLECLEKIAVRHRSVLEKTWSCWHNEGEPCMKCYACRERIVFFGGLDKPCLQDQR
jgi:7-cyano-7-deazaguanine synthase